MTSLFIHCASQGCPHEICGSKKNYRLQDIQLSKSSVAPFGTDEVCPKADQTLVENTGLEPVTSWLQTRRSPS